MRNKFNLLSLTKIAASSGILSDLVQKSIGPKSTEIKPEFKMIGSVGAGTTVMAPKNVVKPDGSVDIIINIRGIAGGDLKTASSLGNNAVVVTAEAGGKGSKENAAAFGHSQFVNSTVSKILASLQKQHPDKKIKRGKLIISGFSGGGSAIANILNQKNDIQGGIDGVILNDALHVNPNDARMQGIIDFAKESTKNPNVKFKLIHTAVEPGSYHSTTEVANHILNQLGLERKPVSEWTGKGPRPVAEAREGGFTVTQLYDKSQPYMMKDPETGQTKPNVPGTAGYQHIQSLRFGLENAFKDIL